MARKTKNHTPLALAAALTVSLAGCIQKSCVPATSNLEMAASAGQPVFSPDIFNTWYCLSPWSDNRPDTERRGMAVFAWHLFVAISWPWKMNADAGQWEKNGDAGALNSPGVLPNWTMNNWFSTERLFLELGRSPSNVPASSPVEPRWDCNESCLRTTLVGRGFGPVYDQNSNPIWYEVRVEQSMYQVLWGAVNREVGAHPIPGAAVLDFFGGQCKDSGPSNTDPDSRDTDASIAIKLAWKRLLVGEDASRFLRRSASLPDAGAVELGLVGFHIAQRSSRYKRWIWATFEHDDNVPESDAGPAERRFSFNDTKCDPSACCPNTSQADPADGGCKTQITRLPRQDAGLDMLGELNRDRKKSLKDQGSVLQHYRLIGVQYVPHPDHGGDVPTPTELRNSVIETFLVGSASPCEGSARPACPGDAGPDARYPDSANDESSSCLGCHGEVARHDFSFIPSTALCNCSSRGRPDAGGWLGDVPCKKLGIDCDAGSAPVLRR